MRNKAVDNYPDVLEFASEYYESQKMCDKTVNTHTSTIQFLPEYYKTQEICYKAVHRCVLYLILFLINIKLKKYVTELIFYIFFNSMLP